MAKKILQIATGETEIPTINSQITYLDYVDSLRVSVPEKALLKRQNYTLSGQLKTYSEWNELFKAK